MPGQDIIVIGASAGGVEALPRMLSALPANLPAAVFVVMHVGTHSQSLLPKIISRTTNLPAKHADDRESIEHGQIYVARPDFHLVVEKNCTRLVHGPKENRHRPAIDPLFRSAAAEFGARVAGVVLTGGLDDGTRGLHAIKECGGTAIVQHPEEAVTPDMPLSAIRNVKIDHILPLAEIGPLLVRLSGKPVRSRGPKRCVEAQKEVIVMENQLTPEEMTRRHGPPSAFVCPDCEGPLWEKKVGSIPSYACFNGHAFSPESLLAGESESVERALWVAVKTLQERASLLNKMAAQASKAKQTISAEQFRQRAAEHRQHADVIRGILDKTPSGSHSNGRT